MVFNICRRCLAFLKTAAITSRSTCVAARICSTPSDVCRPVGGLCVRSRAQFMATSTRVRTEEEKKSRKAARLEKTAAHKQFPFLPSKSSSQVYVLDKALAGDIAEAVVKHQADKTTPVLEANPGPGVLTKALLKAGVNRLVLTESLKSFMPHVKDVQKEFNTNILGLYNLDYFYVWRRQVDTDNINNEFDENMAAVLPHRRWGDGPPVSVVGIVPERKERPFLNHLIMALSRQQSLYSLGRPEWFLAVSPAVYRKLLVAKMEKRRIASYSHLAIVFHLLFDIHLCAQLPGWKFTPHFPEKKVVVMRGEHPDVCNSMRYLVRLRPHVDLPLPLPDIPAFYSFLGQVMQRKKLRLIPKMEQLIPGCGIHLIMMHFTMTTIVADVTPQQFLDIFKAMQTWPEYKGSPVKQILADSSFSVAEEDSVVDTHKNS